MLSTPSSLIQSKHRLVDGAQQGRTQKYNVKSFYAKAHISRGGGKKE